MWLTRSLTRAVLLSGSRWMWAWKRRWSWRSTGRSGNTGGWTFCSPTREGLSRVLGRYRSTTSAGGLNAYPGFGPYCAGKAGAIGLVRSMAFDWGGYGIRVNGLAPTHGMSANFALPPDAEVLGLSYEEAALAESGGTWDPMTFPGPLKIGRPPSLRDNAAVATFLASDDSAYMSGVVIPSCDGGSFARTSIAFPESWSLDTEVSQ